ncbi:MAG TPA: amidohydrolase family protein [Actinomycetota bacterium]|nr:amidohydrolase family protein [Actinomycetota bacterium]
MTDDDPGLPVPFGPVSNGEYQPKPLPPVLRESIRRARDLCERNARRTGMSRREFLLSLPGAAATLYALNACTREAARREPGGRYEVHEEATVEPEPAREAVGGDEFVFDIQGHLLEYDMNPAARDDTFWTRFPQQHCGEDDPRVCFSIDHFVDLMFRRSDTNMVVISALPIWPESSPLSHEVMDETRRVVEGLCRDDRVLLHGLALPNVGSFEANVEAMADAVSRFRISAWKTFTNFPDAFGQPGNAWWLDDHDRALPRVGERFIRASVDLGVSTICTHKGLSGGSPYASPIDVGPAARAHPEVNFVMYHSGYEDELVEGPYRRRTANVGINRLITSMKRAGIGPNENVYAELGTTWWNVMRFPDQAAHVLGKLLKHVGEDNVVWGTDCLFYGSPQPQIQALRAFQISEEYQERFGYPPLTKEIKAKILGLSGARLYGVDPITVPCEFGRRELEEIRKQLPGRNEPLGPKTSAEVAAFRAAHQGWP